jgi:hypothetical protein
MRARDRAREYERLAQRLACGALACIAEIVDKQIERASALVFKDFVDRFLCETFRERVLLGLIESPEKASMRRTHMHRAHKFPGSSLDSHRMPPDD